MHTAPLLDAQPALQLRSSLSFQTLCALPPQNRRLPGLRDVTTTTFWTLTLATLASHHPRISWFVSCQAERQIQLLLRCQVAVVHVDHQLLNENRLAGSDCLFPKHNKNMQRLITFIHINEDPRVVELVVFCIFHHSHLMSSQQHCLSSKFCSCSKARPNKPMLRPEQRAIPSSNPDRPMIRSTKHAPSPWPGRLTNQSCNVRKCVLERKKEKQGRQKAVPKTGQRLCVQNLLCHLRRATSALPAAPSFRHSAAAQPRSATRSSAAQGSRGVAAPARTGAL